MRIPDGVAPRPVAVSENRLVKFRCVVVQIYPSSS